MDDTGNAAHLTDYHFKFFLLGRWGRDGNRGKLCVCPSRNVKIRIAEKSKKCLTKSIYNNKIVAWLKIK